MQAAVGNDDLEGLGGRRSIGKQPLHQQGTAVGEYHVAVLDFGVGSVGDLFGRQIQVLLHKILQTWSCKGTQKKVFLAKLL